MVFRAVVARAHDFGHAQATIVDSCAYCADWAGVKGAD